MTNMFLQNLMNKLRKAAVLKPWLTSLLTSSLISLILPLMILIRISHVISSISYMAQISFHTTSQQGRVVGNYVTSSEHYAVVHQPPYYDLMILCNFKGPLLPVSDFVCCLSFTSCMLSNTRLLLQYYRLQSVKEPLQNIDIRDVLYYGICEAIIPDILLPY